MKQLTKAEEEIMQILWQLKKANVAEIIEQMPNPKPAYIQYQPLCVFLKPSGL